MTHDEREQLRLAVWRGLDEQLRRELLHNVFYGATREPELEALYEIAETMLRRSMVREAMASDCGGVLV